MTFAVSVIVPLRDAEKYLDRMLEQLLALDAENIEFVIIDDHSTDRTASRIESWAGVLPNLTVLAAENAGVAAARNQAVAVAKGEYLWFTDGDDSWEASIVRELLDSARATGADVVACNATKVYANDGRTEPITDAVREQTIGGTEALARLFRGEIQGHLWNKLFARRMFDGVRFPATQMHSDLGATVGLLAAADTVALLPRSLYLYAIHGGSILNRRAYRWEDLEDCLALAMRAAAAMEATAPGIRSDLAVFKYSQVAVPLENQSVRRESWETPETIRQARKRNHQRIRFGELVSLAGGGHATLAAKAAVIKLAPAAYHWLYRQHRQRAFSSLDGAGLPHGGVVGSS